MSCSASDPVTGTEPPAEPPDPATCGDPSCAQVSPDANWLGKFMSVDPDQRLAFHHGEELHMRVHASNRTRFAELTRSLEEDPGDFVSCYEWLQLHPVFWRYRVPRALTDIHVADPTGPQVARVETLENLDDTDGLQHLWMSVTRASEPDELGGPGPRFLLEHGPHMWASESRAEDAPVPLGGYPTHDVDLDVWAATYEAGIVTLAGRVREIYGTDRSRVHGTGHDDRDSAAHAVGTGNDE